MRKEEPHLRKAVVKTKLTASEKEKLDQLCREHGLSRSSFIRQAIFTGKIFSRKKPKDEDSGDPKEKQPLHPRQILMDHATENESSSRKGES